MITEKNNVFYCDCGFSFQRGRSGSHDCADGLRNKLAEYEVRYAALAAENAWLKQFPDQIVGFIGKMGSSEIGSETKEKIEAAAKKIKTPVTDAFLAEVRAQGVEMFSQFILRDACGDRESQRDIGEVLGAAKYFAAQLRKGVQS
ncbi:hypothetical protein [Enterobacter mori]|uniref:Uncharacterized protein n=1 Tax=Enterobacter mori TaxID=539813 RepID=A0A9Q7K1U4_9ENTR|nr:hypothetical protein [Enterobacter mori]MCC8228793.1 hypothetical protein [Enterobacter mori]MCC8238180.1 hypothetical protein [Enterobacter mori]RTQ22687.1 hypothetical protein EKN29_18785 [Enterobacter mori]